ncbi:hypothetical protein HJC23_007776 [Cyclotella cryptica]|uniref:Exoribonuclease phosphorolytic domain-containing protein n=1 Tax=Cyclotella cryptica TaxID=29204 RepID=A0ABD3RDP9_9STRA
MTCPRPTNREPSALRPLSAALSPLHHTDGSASLQCGNTHVMAGVYGPIAPRISQREWMDGGVVSVVFSKGTMTAGVGGGGGGGTSSDGNGRDVVVPNGGMKPLATPLPSGGGATERELEHFLCDALSSCIMLERYPRCVIQVVIQILQADGSVLGTALNCAVLALMDAGVAMRGLPVACTCVVVEGRDESGQQQQQHEEERENERSIWIDPTAEEESAEGHSIVVLVTESTSSSNNQVASIERPSQELLITSFTYGAPMSMQGLLQCMESVGQCNVATVAFMRMAVEQKVQREVVTLWS